MKTIYKIKTESDSQRGLRIVVAAMLAAYCMGFMTACFMGVW